MERGYDNVTVADICARAEIAPRTFHRYFAGKEDLVVEPVRHMTGMVAERLAAAPAHVSDSVALQQAMRELGGFVLDHTDWLTALRTVVHQSHQLRETHLAVPPEHERHLCTLLAERRPHAAQPEWRRRLLVGYASAAFRVWYDDYLRGELTDPLGRLDEMLLTLRDGIGDA